MIRRTSHALLPLLLAALFLSSCLGPRGDTVQEKRASALEMRDEALAVMYADKPHLEQRVAKSAGYVVFKNFSVHPGLLSFASGFGVLTNNATEEVTHLKWLRLTIGPGIAIKGLYALVILEDAATVERFVKGPWVAGGQIEAGLVFGDFGGSIEIGYAFNRTVEVHYTTHTGIALELELIGIGKVSNNRKLNETTTP